jgi:hypothetical protein
MLRAAIDLAHQAVAILARAHTMHARKIGAGAGEAARIAPAPDQMIVTQRFAGGG